MADSFTGQKTQPTKVLKEQKKYTNNPKIQYAHTDTKTQQIP